MSDIFSAIVVIVGFCLFLVYVRNLILLKQLIQDEIYGIITIVRIIGVFFPVLGVFMGFIKNSKPDLINE